MLHKSTLFDTFLSNPHISGRWQSTSSSSRHGCDGASKHFCARHQLPPHLHRLPHPRPPPDPRQRSQKPEEQFGRRLCCLWPHMLLSSLSSLSAGPQVSHCMFSQLQKITTKYLLSNQVLFGAGWFFVHSLLFPTLLPLPLPPVHLLRPPRSRGCHPLDCSGARDPIPKPRDESSSYQTQGHMLAASSSCDTVSRNCGIFWSIFQVSSNTRVTSIKLHNHNLKSLKYILTMMWNLAGGSCTVCPPGLGLVGWRGGKRNGKFDLF